MINIISPKSVYVNNDDPSTYTLNWEGSLPSGQVSYEVLYKEKGSETWLTTGKVMSTDTTYDLRNIYTLVNIDFVEIEYKVTITYESINDGETIRGNESSNTFSLIFNQGISGDLNVWVNSEKRSYPMFSTINNDNVNTLAIRTTDGDKLLPLVDEDSVLASDMRVRVSSDKTQSVAGYDPDFKYYTPTDSDVFGTIEVEGQYNYNYQSSYNYISSYGYNYSYYDGTASDTYCTQEDGYAYYNYLASSTQNELTGTDSYITNYSYKYSYRRSDLAYGLKYYNYLRSSVRNYLNKSYYYQPSKLVSAVYLVYSTTYQYSYYGGGSGDTTNFYARYYTYASGVYLSRVVIRSFGSSSFGRSYSYATTADAYLAYNYMASETLYYYTYTNVYAYDKTYYYSFLRYSTVYNYTRDVYAYRDYTYYTYTNVYAYDKTYQYVYYHYNNLYYWNNYAYGYTDDTYSYNYKTIEDTKTYNYTYYC